MAEDYYGNEGDAGEEPSTPEEEAPEGDVETEETEKPDKESDEGESAVIPDSFFPSDCKVGDTYTIKVVSQLDGEKGVTMAKAEKPKAEETMMDRIRAKAA